MTALASPAPDPGLYGPDSETWRLNREALILLAGPRALLLQIAHPLVAEGVDQHSSFRSDPWYRLHNTLRSYLTIIYGTTATGRAEIRRLNALHRDITGPVNDANARQRHGPVYSARDPELALWVHATLVDSTMVTADAWIRRLDAARRARLYEETRPVGRAFGIPDSLLPRDIEAFDRYLDRMLDPTGPIHPSPTARAMAPFILQPRLPPQLPALDWLPSVTYRWTAWPAVALLPQRIRREFGLSWSPIHEAVSRWLVGGFRLWRPVIPTALRWMPAARRAERRLAVSRGAGSETRSVA